MKTYVIKAEETKYITDTSIHFSYLYPFKNYSILITNELSETNYTINFKTKPGSKFSNLIIVDICTFFLYFRALRSSKCYS